jgi:uncharacterized integral membrane protein
MNKTMNNGQSMANKTRQQKIWFHVAVALFLVILLIHETTALGIAPTRKVESYTPGASYTIESVIINNEGKNMRVLILPQGDLGKYVTIKNNIIKVTSDQGEVPFTYTVTLPENTTLSPGATMLRMAFIELPSGFSDRFVINEGQVISLEEDRAAISATSAIVQQIVLNVPYPASYADGKIYVTSDEAGQPVKLSVSVFNRGKEQIKAKGYALILGPTNEEIAKIDLGETTVGGMDESRLVGVWEGTNLGDYIAEAYVTYGDQSFAAKTTFVLGKPQISIEKMGVKNFKLGSIAKFEVDVLSRWNKMIKDVNGEMKILDKNGAVIDTFPTTEIDLPPHGTTTITGYWDTENTKIGEYDVNVELNYEGQKSQKLFETVVSIDAIDVKGGKSVGQVIGAKKEGGQYTLLIILIIVLIIVNIVIFLYFRKMKEWFRRPPSGGNEGTGKRNPPTTPSAPPPPPSASNTSALASALCVFSKLIAVIGGGA